MTDWNPRQKMNFLRYLKFKMGKWVKVSSLPEWAYRANDGYYEGFIEKYGHRPYDVEKVYNGDSLQYKIYYKTVSMPGGIEEEYFTRLKR